MSKGKQIRTRKGAKSKPSGRTRRPPITEHQVRQAIQVLKDRNEPVTMRKLLAMTGGSYSTLRDILRRLVQRKLLSANLGREWLLRACLARRSEQLDSMLSWAREVASLLVAHGVAVPALPDNAGPARLGSAQWPYPRADELDDYVLLDHDLPGEPADEPPAQSEAAPIYLRYEGRLVDGSYAEDGCEWAVGHSIPSSATLARNLATALSLEGGIRPVSGYPPSTSSVLLPSACQPRLYVCEHSTCDEPTQVDDCDTGIGAARGSSQRAPPHATPDGGDRSSP